MAATRSHPVFAITFAVTYAILYVLAVENNWALFTYHPVTEEFHFLVDESGGWTIDVLVRLDGHGRLGRAVHLRHCRLAAGGVNQPSGDRSFLGDSTGHNGLLCLSHEGFLFPIKLE